MFKYLRLPLVQAGAGVALATVLAAVLIPGPLHHLFSNGFFMPHRHCYLDDPRMIWLQGLSDTSIGVAYMAISGTLAYLVYRARRSIPFEWMFLSFGVFIFSCGLTHFMEVWTLWFPTYWLSGALKAVTAVASIATGIGLAPLVPRVFSLVEAARCSEQRRQALEKAHAEMAQLNERLRELDRMKSEFFANISHELRTPLTLILGNADQLRADSALSPAQVRTLGIVKRNGQILLNQVNDLLEAARLEAGRLQLHYSQTDLGQLLRLSCSNFETVAHERDIRFEILTPETLDAEADPERLEEVLFNLLSNAFKFTPAGGRIRAQAREEDGSAILEIADSGPGIPSHERALIFERFRQLEGGDARRFGGTGLGLSITRNLVELHGGKIEVRDSPEGGTLFVVTIPRKAPPGTAVQARTAVPAVPASTHSAEVLVPAVALAAPVERPGRSEPTVLVVEDNEELNELVRNILAPEFNTISARNGVEGLAKARASQPDLILTDLMMPEMSGEQFVQKVRAEPAMDSIPIVVLTARADERVRVQLLREGVQDYLVKPFTREELRARAGNLISARRSQQELARAYSEMQAFSYSLAHDIRAPLRSIRAFAHLLCDEHASRLDPEGLQIAQRIITAGDRLDHLVADVLTYTRMHDSQPELQPVDLSQFLRVLIADRADFQPPRAEIVLKAPLHLVKANEASLTQAIMNLLGNAVKFVPPGTVPRVEVSTARSDGFVRISFQDNGIGISARDQKKLFRLFERVHGGEYEGTGMGLAIVKKAVERVGGRVGLDSEAGRGSVFWLELPAA